MSFNYLPLLPVFESLGDWIAKGAASNNSKKEISLLWCWQVDPLYETSSKMKLALKRCCLWKWSSHLLWDSGVRAEIAPGGTNWAGPMGCVICLCVCACAIVCAYTCAHIQTHLFQKQDQQGFLPLSRVIEAHFRMGSMIQKKANLPFMIKRSGSLFRKHSSLPSKLPSVSVWGCHVFTVA